LEHLELLIVHKLKAAPQFANAAVIFPSTTFAEKEGTFTNHAGRVQRIYKMINPPPGWMAEGEIFTALLNRLGSPQGRFEPLSIWEAMAANGTAFAGLRFDQIGPYGAPLETADADGAKHP
jgi:predicted molibdopterin-dependent oxidoreductase YjgC